MNIVPLQPVPSQTLTVTLGGQAVGLAVYQKGTAADPVGIFVDIYVNNILVLGGVIGLNVVRLKRSGYIPFVGNLAFFDTEGSSDPYYTGLGTRWVLVYGTDAELATGPQQIAAGTFVPWGYLISPEVGYFLSYDGVNPIAAYIPP